MIKKPPMGERKKLLDRAPGKKNGLCKGLTVSPQALVVHLGLFFPCPSATQSKRLDCQQPGTGKPKPPMGVGQGGWGVSEWYPYNHYK